MKIDKQRWILGCSLAVSIAIVFAIVLLKRRGARTDTYRIGAIVFLTGPQAPLGEEVRNALTIAMEEINANGGINTKRVELVYEDSKDSPREAITAFYRLEAERIPVVISTGDVVSLNLAPIAGERKIPVIATVAAGPEITRRSNYVFRVFLQTAPPAKMMAEFAYKKLAISSVGLLSINNEFGLASDAAFRESFEKLGGRITAVEHYGITDRDVRSQIVKLKYSSPQAIFVGGFGEGYGACIKQIKEMKFEGLLLTTNSLSIPYFQNQTWPASEGAYFTSTLYDEYYNTPGAIKFTNEYKRRFGRSPSYIAAFAYDSLKLTALAIEKGGYTSEGVRNALLTIHDYEGLAGTMGFDNQGEVSFRLVIKRIENGRPVVVHTNDNF